MPDYVTIVHCGSPRIYFMQNDEIVWTNTPPNPQWLECFTKSFKYSIHRILCLSVSNLRYLHCRRPNTSRKHMLSISRPCLNMFFIQFQEIYLLFFSVHVLSRFILVWNLWFVLEFLDCVVYGNYLIVIDLYC